MRTRAVLTIVISLITGFLIGFLASSQITRFRTRDVRSMSSAESLKMRTYEMIKPTAEQMENLDPIVYEYSERFDSMRSVTHKGFTAIIEEYHNSLSHHLNENQIQVIDEFAKGLRKKKHNDDDKEKNHDKND
jgi:hypothetical protein